MSWELIVEGKLKIRFPVLSIKYMLYLQNVMRKILVFCLLLMPFVDYGQDWLWAHQQIGGNWRNESSICYTDKQNNIYVGGYTVGNHAPDSIGFGSHIYYDTPFTNFQIIIAKYDSSGNVLWTTASSNGSCYNICNVTTDVFGNMYLFGSFEDSVRFGTHLLVNPRYDYSLGSAANNNCYFIIKYNQYGNILWTKTGDRVNGNAINQSGGICVDNIGNIYIAAAFIDSVIHIGVSTLINPEGNIISGKTDIFFAKYDSSGNVIWAKKFGGTGNDFVSGLTINNKGEIFLLGYYYSPTIFFGSSYLSYYGTGSGYPNMFLSRFDSLGNPIWVRGETGLVTPYALTTDNIDNIYIGGGIYDSSLTIGAFSFNNKHLNRSGFIAKYDTLGNVLWAKAISPITTPSDSIHLRNTVFSLVTDPCNNVWVDGQMCNDSIFVDSAKILYAPASSHLPTMFLTYNPNGNLLNYEALPVEMKNNYANSFLSVDSACNIYLSGTYAGAELILSNDTLKRGPEAPLETIFVAKYRSTLNCKTNTYIPTTNVNYNITLYPNPAQNVFTINTTDFFSICKTIDIYDIVGNKYDSYSFTGSSITISSCRYTPGIYVCKIRINNNISIKKIVIER